MEQQGHTLKILREKRNLTQQALALKLRVGTRIIEQFESGEKIPDIPTLLRLSAVLEVPASELYGHSTPPFLPVIDSEISQLISGLGSHKAKLILRKVKELTEEEYKEMLNWLFNNKNTIDQH
ncbi:helix-turn-helix domain-containing protein [Peribacillus deserti]|uniref:Transcriptional regulator n=1 Tax=Peribacillus deserti TaxID=673318 RepID=A0A2N5M8X7_9BACI|nr:helix-turn-helix transcriptional regulator [Peribacillus deserti]PLT30800.1 transcriptional regulator [Peribacillus deserti]